MSIKISLKKNINDKLIKNYVLFANEKYKINGLSKISLSKNAAEINENIVSNSDNKKKFLLFNIRPNQKIIIIKTDNNQSSLKNEEIGAELGALKEEEVAVQKSSSENSADTVPEPDPLSPEMV